MFIAIAKVTHLCTEFVLRQNQTTKKVTSEILHETCINNIFQIELAPRFLNKALIGSQNLLPQYFAANSFCLIRLSICVKMCRNRLSLDAIKILLFTIMLLIPCIPFHIVCKLRLDVPQTASSLCGLSPFVLFLSS